ncbi:hypothetical protein [Streptomyces sp. NPDC056682]|uniref:hypothetical protein n=1 Tax=Streptomyces sp. NPDC056682 TaxID=3345909 RepID=UPI0036C18AD1
MTKTNAPAEGFFRTVQSTEWITVPVIAGEIAAAQGTPGVLADRAVLDRRAQHIVSGTGREPARPSAVQAALLG